MDFGRGSPIWKDLKVSKYETKTEVTITQISHPRRVLHRYYKVFDNMAASNLIASFVIIYYLLLDNESGNDVR